MRQCGYKGLNVRNSTIRPISALLLGALGACQEYNDEGEQVLPISGGSPFVEMGRGKVHHTPGGPSGDIVRGLGSKLCPDSNQRPPFWMDFLANAFFIVFLIRLQSLSRKAAQEEDYSAWTAADYAVEISGLDDDPATYADDFKGTPGLKSRLMKDLTEKMGFDPSEIVQIELGRFCQNEMLLLRKLLAAQEKKEELQGRIKSIELIPKPSLIDKLLISTNYKDSKQELIEKATKQLGKTQADVDGLVQELAVLADEPDRCTGHAYVVFQTEDARDRCVKFFPSHKKRRTDLARELFKKGSKTKWNVTTSTLVEPFESMKKGGELSVGTAPEPDEIIWANLQLDDEHQRRAEQVNYTAISLLCLVGAGIIMGLKGILVDYKEDKNYGTAFESGSSEYLNYLATSNGISIGAAITSLIINALLKTSTIALTRREGQDTETEYQRSIFTKLSIAYVVNMVVVPLAIGFLQSGNTSGKPVDQAWYEDSGITFTLITTLLINTVAVDFVKVVQPVEILKHRIIAPIFKSQARAEFETKSKRFEIGKPRQTKHHIQPAARAATS